MNILIKLTNTWPTPDLYLQELKKYPKNSLISLSYWGALNIFNDEYIDYCNDILKDHRLVIGFDLLQNIDTQKSYISKLIDTTKISSWFSVAFNELSTDESKNFIRNYHYLKKLGVDIKISSIAHPSMTIDEYADYRQHYMYDNDITYSDCLYTDVYNGVQYPQNYSDEELIGFNLASSYKRFMYPNHTTNLSSKEEHVRILEDGTIQTVYDIWGENDDFISTSGNLLERAS